MKWDRRRTAAARAIIRGGRRDIVAGTLAGLGGAIAIATMEWLSTTAHYPLAVIPFATSIVLVIGAPEAVPAQPRAPVGGHLVATLVGFAVLWVTGPQAWAAALAVGLVHSRDVPHRDVPPAGGHQSAAGRLRQPAVVVPARAGAGRRAAAGCLRLRLAPLGQPPAMAAASAIDRARAVIRLAVLALASCSVKRSPSRTRMMLR